MLWSANGSIVSQFIVRRSLYLEIVIFVAAFYLNAFNYLISEPISGQYSLSIPPENIRKPENELIHFNPIFHFYTPWKRQKTKGFLTFSRGIEMEHWTKMD